ncbi:hypothetical protein C3L33_03639, partial [Rhododendron williamsianum]
MMQRNQQDQRSRSAKPTTVHGCAQSGDLVGIQKLLQDNPSLLNDRNPVESVIVSVVSDVIKGSNEMGFDRIVESGVTLGYSIVVSFVYESECRLDFWYGETPLHMASKNGCNEAAQLLLANGAFVEPKQMCNGMTPLHLAVWHSLRAEDCSTVKTLLEYNADCSAEDNEGMTPLNHLSQGPGSEKLRELLCWHRDEQRKRKAIEACSETKAKMDELEDALSNIVGTKTRRKIKEAEGGILLVDEAYRLIPMQKSDDKDYGLEALEEIMSVMDGGKVVVIFAGYSEPMKRVITSNEGFCRRVTKFFHFDDLSSIDLANILHLKMNNQAEDSLLYGFKLHPSCTVDVVATLIETETNEKQRKEMNGGIVDPMLVNARENLDLRLNFDCVDTNELLTITLEDLEAGIRSLSR